jgi:putative aldouronate transport system permease protein
MIITGSISNEQDIAKYGYTLFPRHIDLISYRVLLLDFKSIANSYMISMIVTVAGTIASLLINTLMAYAISRKSLRYRKVISIYTLITILFNGGMVPWYIVCVNYLHLKDTLIALIVPYLANAWYIFLLRNYIQTIPDAMHESAKIDGAGEYTIFFKIILPLMTPALATVGLFTALGYWNDWWLGLMLVDKTELQPLQLLLRTIVSNIMFLKASTNAAAMQALIVTLPSEGIKMAICVITIGPIIFLYPFLQKYFVKGIMIGAVKG